MTPKASSVSARECFSGSAPVRAIARAPHAAAFAVSAGKRVVQIVDCQPRRESPMLCEIGALAFSPAGDRLAVGCNGGRLLIVAADSHEVSARLRSDAPGYHELTWSPDGRVVAAGQREPRVTIIDPGTGTVLRVLDPDVFDDEGRTAVTFSPDGDVLASTAYNAVLLWPGDQLTSGRASIARKKLAVRGHAHLLDLAFSSDGQSIAALAESEGRSAIHLWETGSGERLTRIPLPRLAIRLVWLGDLLAVGEVRGEGVSLWSTATARRVDVILAGASGATVTALDRSTDGKALVAGTDRGQVFWWAMDAGVNN
jgi:WD40 repeat protein